MPALADEHRRQLVRELARAPGGTWITCAGRSMEPTIKQGDRVRVVACARVRTGDVVLFEAGRAHVLHRVVCTIPGTPWFLHVGDAGSGDGPGLAHAATVVGRVETARRLPRPAMCMAAALRLVRAGLRVVARATGGHGARRA